jgi:hypothetical protein
MAWLTPRRDALVHSKRQLTHGDWATPNLKLTDLKRGAALSGVLDWQYAAIDPPVMDLAQSASSILMSSGRRDAGQMVERLPLGTAPQVSRPAFFTSRWCPIGYTTTFGSTELWSPALPVTGQRDRWPIVRHPST